jgi:hypothetical protein
MFWTIEVEKPGGWYFRETEATTPQELQALILNFVGPHMRKPVPIRIKRIDMPIEMRTLACKRDQ